jgi:hypothetical protein
MPTYRVVYAHGIVLARAAGGVRFHGVYGAIFVDAPDRPSAYLAAAVSLAHEGFAVWVTRSGADGRPLDFTDDELATVRAGGGALEERLPRPVALAAAVESVTELPRLPGA